VYIERKLQAIRQSGQRVWAEMGWLHHSFPGPCAIMSQGHPENRQALVIAKVEDGKIRRLDMCCMPPPDSAVGTGEFPR